MDLWTALAAHLSIAIGESSKENPLILVRLFESGSGDKIATLPGLAAAFFLFQFS
ncbi:MULTISPECIES: hypothetical protein [unclassified Schlesneria]|uniref:hypothetical protein n=1 Tax=Schlesneria TaxID=656899 RepID=UPI00359F6FC7